MRPTHPLCTLCEHAVSVGFDIPLEALRLPTRGVREIARARQIAMYFAVVTFEVPMSEVAAHFGRDRSTVSHALSRVEDERKDKPDAFELMMLQLEAMLGLTREVWESRQNTRAA
jgi:chromosomal replication initiation ATPase DnaA